MAPLTDPQLLLLFEQYLPNNDNEFITPSDLRYVLAQLVEAKVSADVLSTFAQLAGPRFTGTPQVPTAPAGTASDQAASTAFVQAALSAIASGKNLSELVLPQYVTGGNWYLTPAGFWEARGSFNAQAPPVNGPNWKLLAGFSGPLTTLPVANLTDATDAGRAMLTAANASAQRALVNNPRIPAGKYGAHPGFDTEDGPAGSWAWVFRAISTLMSAVGVQQPAAPTEGKVNDVAKEFTFKVNPAYPSYLQYKESGRPGTTAPAYLSAATAYQVGDIVHVMGLAGAPKGSLAYYVAGSGNLPDGAVLTNDDLFTGSAVVTPPVTNTPPSVTASAQVTGTSVKLTGLATDADGVDSIFLKVFDSLGATVQTFGPSVPGDTSFVTTWASGSPGDYTVRAIATDSKGLPATSSPASFTLAAATVTPDTPVVVYSSATRKLTATATPAGTILFSYQGSAWLEYLGAIQVDNLGHNPQEWRFKRAASAGYAESDISYSPSIAPAPTNDLLNLFGDGNSILHGTTEDNGSNGGYNGMQEKIPAAVTSRLRVSGRATAVKYESIAVPGQRIQEMLGRQTQFMFPLYDPTAKFNVLTFLEAGNSMSGLRLDANGVPVGWNTAQEAYDLTKQYCQQAKAQYPDLKIVVCTVTPRGGRNYFHIDHPYYQELLRFQYNALIRLAKANGEAWIDAVADLALDGRIGAPWSDENPLYYDSGRVHMMAAGAEVTAGIIADAALEACYGIAQPAPFPIINTVAAPATTEENDPTRRLMPLGSWARNTTSDSVFAGGFGAYNTSGATDGSVSATDGFIGDSYRIGGPFSPNCGPFDVLHMGFKVYSGTALSPDTKADQDYYAESNLAPGLYGGQHLVRVVYKGANAFTDRDKFGITGSSGKVATPSFKGVPTDDGGTLTWGNVGADSYTIQESQNPNSFPAGTGVVYTGKALFSTTLTGRNYRENYYYKIVASKAGMTSSDPLIIKMTPGSPAAKPAPIDQNGVYFDTVATAGITKDAGNAVFEWLDSLRGLKFRTDNSIKPTWIASDPSFNRQPTVSEVGNTDFGMPTPDLGQVQEFDLYIGCGVPDSATQVLVSNRINSNNYWSVNSNSVELGPNFPITFDNPNYATAMFILVTFRLDKVTVYLNGVKVAERANPAAYTNAGGGILLGYQFMSEVVRRATASFSRVLMTQPRSDSQRLNDNANFFYDLAI